MWETVAYLWLAAVKRPLSVLADALFFRGLRASRQTAFGDWAQEAAAGGPPAIAAAIKQRIAYGYDPLKGLIDHVTSPTVTWARGRGDCDDFAYLSAALLNLAGLDCWIVNYLARNIVDSHVVCLYRDGDGYAALDQGYLSKRCESLEAAARAAAPTPKLLFTLIQPYGRDGDYLGRWVRATMAAISERDTHESDRPS